MVDSVPSKAPTRAPAFRAIFDTKLIASMALLGLVAVVSCDLVNRAVNRRVLPTAREPDPKSWTVGSSDRVIFALKTQDAERAACASSQTFEDYRCEYDGNKRRTPRAPEEPVDDNLRLVLAPLQTAVGGHHVLVGGVWHTPQLAFRRHREPARERRGSQLQTFYAECALTFLGRVDSAEVRFDFGKPWATSKDLAVAKATRCTILEADGANHPTLAAAAH